MFWATQIIPPIEVAGVCIRNTSLAGEEARCASGVRSVWLLRHLLRTCVFAELLSRRIAMKWNSELLFRGAIIDDLGLTVDSADIERSELDGADSRSRFLEMGGVLKRSLQQVLRQRGIELPHFCKGINLASFESRSG